MLIATRRFVAETFDRNAEERILGRLSEGARAAVEAASRSQWCPGSSWSEFIEAVGEEDSSTPTRFEHMRKVGRFMATEATGTYLRLLLKLFSPGMFLRKLPSFFERDIRPGKLEADISALDRGRVTISIKGADWFPYLSPVAAGWVEYVFEQIGVRESRWDFVRPSMDDVRSGDILYEISWT
jgi:hypothetical protein